MTATPAWVSRIPIQAGLSYELGSTGMDNIIQDHLPSSISIIVDLSDGYSFPTDVAATDLRLDIMWWNYDQKTLTLVELTVRFETSYEAAITRKEDRYPVY